MSPFFFKCLFFRYIYFFILIACVACITQLSPKAFSCRCHLSFHCLWQFSCRNRALDYICFMPSTYNAYNTSSACIWTEIELSSFQAVTAVSCCMKCYTSETILNSIFSNYSIIFKHGIKRRGLITFKNSDFWHNSTS